MSEYGKFLSAAQEIKHDGPAPTPAPVLVRDAAARKRQTTSDSTTFTLTKAPDSTCGFLSGSPGVGITCENKKTCLWETQYISAIICGTAAEDPIILRCLNREDALNTASCNDVCQSNSFNLLCTETASPYCRTYAYPSNVRGYKCAASPVSAIQSVDFTYNNQDDRTLTVSELGGPILSFIPAAATVGTTRTPGRTPTDSTTGAVRTTTAIVSASVQPSEGGSSPPVGAIVGGVVGGLAVIGLLVLGAFFLIRRKKSQDLNTTQPGPGVPPTDQKYGYGGPPPMQQQYMAPPSESIGPVSPTSTYDPNFKGHGSISMASAVAPGMTQEDYNRMSYAPPIYQQQGGSPPPQTQQPQPPQQTQQTPPMGYQQPQAPYPQGSPSPPIVYQQAPVPPGPGYPQQGPNGQPMYEIGTVPDQHRGQVHEVS